MEEMYVMLRPRDFWKYGTVNYEGDYPRDNISDFNVDEKYNYIIFKLKYNSQEEKKEFINAEVVGYSGREALFDVKYNDLTKEIELGSDYLGMYTIFTHKLDSIEVKPSKAAGFFKELESNDEALVNYMNSMEETFEICRFFKEEYNSTINGPSNNLIKTIKKRYRRIR